MTDYFWTIDLLALATSCLSLFYTVRLRSTYFLGSRFFIALANLSFAVVLVQSTLSDFLVRPTSEPLYLSMISVMLFSVGFASYLLQTHNASAGIREISDFFSHLPRQFVLYAGVVVAWTGMVLITQPYQSMSTPDGIVYYEPQVIFGIANLLVLLSFLFLPVLTFYKQSSLTKDPKAAGSIRTISLAWASFGLVAFLQSIVTPATFPASQSLLQMANGILFLLIAYALREPTVLGRMIGGSITRTEGRYFGIGGVIIVKYDVESDRRRFVEDFLRAETNPAASVLCYVAKSDVPFYHAVISEASVQKAEQKPPKVTIRPIESSSLNEISNEELGQSRRELIDTGDLELSTCKKFAEERRRIDQLGRAPKDRVWAISSDVDRTVLLEEIMKLNPGARVVDLAANQNSFSQRLGTDHASLLGNRILLEFDPMSNFEDIVEEFVSEFVSNSQPVAVFTSLGSPVFKQLQEMRNVRLFVFSSKISTPFRATDWQVLLPDRDSSLLLDAVDKLLQAHRGERVGLVLEALTDIIVSQGFEKSYGIVSSIMEMLESGDSTGLVLLNTTCLDETVVQGVRGLFKRNYRYGLEGFSNIRANSSGISQPSTEILGAFDKQDPAMRSETAS